LHITAYLVNGYNDRKYLLLWVLQLAFAFLAEQGQTDEWVSQ